MDESLFGCSSYQNPKLTFVGGEEEVEEAGGAEGAEGVIPIRNSIRNIFLQKLFNFEFCRLAFP